MKKKDQEAIARLYTENFNDNPYTDDFDNVRNRQSEVDSESGRFDDMYVKGKGLLKQTLEQMESFDLDETIESLKHVIKMFEVSLKQGEENFKDNYL